MSGPMFTAPRLRLDALIDEIEGHDTTMGASFAHLTGLIGNDEQLASLIGLAEIYLNSVNMEAVLGEERAHRLADRARTIYKENLR